MPGGLLIRGLRSLPIWWHPDDASLARRRSISQEKLLDLLDWPDSTMLGEWELHSHSPVQSATPV